MKNKFLIGAVLISFLINVDNVNAQKIYGKVLYKKSSIIKNEKKNKKRTTTAEDSADKMLKSAYKKMEEINYFLEFNSTSSIFQEDLKMQVDNEKNTIAYILSKSLGDTDGVFYTERKLNKTLHQKEFESELFLVKVSTKNKWVLTQETKKIGKYTCYKAIKKDSYIDSSVNTIDINVVAWYAPEIPYSYGPTKYNGLPGLILELTNHQITISASKIVLENVQKIIKKPKKGIEITQKKYDSIITGLAKDFRKRYKRN